jgi:predicted DNA-binding antitoxin AbrB/MazE fold protein
VKLIQAVELQNGEKVESIAITEPTVDQMRSANMVKDDFAATLAVLSSASGQPLGVINRLKMRDLSLAGSVLAFFV